MAKMTTGMVRLAATAACSAISGPVVTSNSTFDRTKSAVSAKSRWGSLVLPDDFDRQILTLAETGLFQFIEEGRIARSGDRIVKPDPQNSDPGGPAQPA